MSTITATRLDELVDYIQGGRILDAMQEFYADDVSMQENGNPPTVGLADNVEREKVFLSNVKEWKGFTVLSKSSDGDVSFLECRMEFVDQQDREVRLEQVAVARWRGGKITSERFYYDSGS